MLAPHLRDAGDHHVQLDLFDAPVSSARLGDRLVREALGFVELLHLEQCQHFRAVGDEGEACLGMLLGELQRTVDETERDRSVASKEDPVRYRTQVAQLTADITRLRRCVVRALHRLGGIASVAFEKRDHAKLAGGAVLPSGVAEFASKFADEQPVALGRTNVPLEVDVALGGEAAQAQAIVVRRQRTFKIGCDLV